MFSAVGRAIAIAALIQQSFSASTPSANFDQGTGNANAGHMPPAARGQSIEISAGLLRCFVRLPMPGFCCPDMVTQAAFMVTGEADTQ